MWNLLTDCRNFFSFQNLLVGRKKSDAGKNIMNFVSLLQNETVKFTNWLWKIMRNLIIGYRGKKSKFSHSIAGKHSKICQLVAWKKNHKIHESAAGQNHITHPVAAWKRKKKNMSFSSESQRQIPKFAVSPIGHVKKKYLEICQSFAGK